MHERASERSREEEEERDVVGTSPSLLLEPPLDDTKFLHHVSHHTRTRAHAHTQHPLLSLSLFFVHVFYDVFVVALLLVARALNKEGFMEGWPCTGHFDAVLIKEKNRPFFIFLTRL